MTLTEFDRALETVRGGVTFDAASHLYAKHGRVLTSVTQLLKVYNLSPTYAGIHPDTLAAAAERGQQFEADVAANLDAYDALRGHFEQRFASGHYLSRVLKQIPLYDALTDVAGTLDLIAVYATPADIITAIDVIDLKATAEMYHSHPIQVAGYVQILSALPPVAECLRAHAPAPITITGYLYYAGGGFYRVATRAAAIWRQVIGLHQSYAIPLHELARPV